tara:strand:+ start:264 stop:605 length:342 start_codon:yes stop_codon:yes gene_type:complete
MKKLFITLFILFITLTTQAQKQFEGEWVSKTSSHITTIIASDYAILKVFNFSFKEDSYIEEKILVQTDYEFTTKLYNSRNGYTVIVKYKTKNDILICEFSGDFHGVVELTRKE